MERSLLVVCNGMARGGSTLQYTLVRSLLDATVGCTVHGYSSPNATHVQYMPVEKLLRWAASPDYHVVKMHTAHPHARELLANGRTKFCYIYRDLRDVAVSRQTAFGERGDVLLASLRKSEGEYHHLRELSRAFPEHFIWHRYEDTTRDLRSAALDGARLLSLSVTDEVATAVAEACSVDAAKEKCDKQRARLVAKVQAVREENPRLAAEYLQAIGRGTVTQSIIEINNDSLLLYNHISPHQGASGVWDTRLSPTVRQQVMGQHREWLRELGYLAEADDDERRQDNDGDTCAEDDARGVALDTPL